MLSLSSDAVIMALEIKGPMKAEVFPIWVQVSTYPRIWQMTWRTTENNAKNKNLGLTWVSDYLSRCSTHLRLRWNLAYHSLAIGVPRANHQTVKSLIQPFNCQAGRGVQTATNYQISQTCLNPNLLVWTPTRPHIVNTWAKPNQAHREKVRSGHWQGSKRHWMTASRG